MLTNLNQILLVFIVLSMQTNFGGANLKVQKLTYELIKAADSGDLKIVKNCLENNADINAQDDGKWTALNQATLQGHILIVKFLLEEGANINTQNKNGLTPLIWAARHRYIDICRLLLEHNADVNIQSKKKNTALIWASSKGHAQIVKLLLDKDANVDISDISGNTALIYAAGNGYTKTVKLLLDKNANVNIQNQKNETALMWAVKNEHIEVVKLLLNHTDIDINLKDNKGKNALQIAREKQYSNIAYLITKKYYLEYLNDNEPSLANNIANYCHLPLELGTIITEYSKLDYPKFDEKLNSKDTNQYL